MHNYEIIICYFIAYATWLVKCRYRSNISVSYAVRFRSGSHFFGIFDVMSHVALKRKGYVTQKEHAYYYFPAVAHSRISDENVFQFSLVYKFVPRTNANFISLPFLPLLSSPSGRRCLRKNQLYPAISIGLHAKTSTLYCYHRHIIRDIGTSHFPVGGRRIGSHVRANRGREADRTTNPRVCSCDIERAFTRRVSPDRCDSHKNRQPIIHGELASQTHI